MKPKIKLHENEEIIIDCRPKNSLIAYLFFSKIFGQLFTIVFFIIFFLSDRHNGLLSDLTSLESGIRSHILLTLLVTAGLALLFVFWAVAAVRKHHFFFTNQRCIVYAGFWGINKKVLPYKSVVDVDLRQNPFRALFGITAVYLDQKGLGFRSRRRQNCVTVDGLDHATAEKIVDLVSGHISAS